MMLITIVIALIAYVQAERYSSVKGESCGKMINHERQSLTILVSSYPKTNNLFSKTRSPYSFEENTREPTTKAVSDFFHRDSRVGFIRKVYTIFGAQTLATVVMLFAALNDRSFKNYLLHSAAPLSSISAVVSLGIGLLLNIFQTVRHRFPINILLLSIFTLAYATSFTIFSLQYAPNIIFMSLFYTCITFAVITSYTFNNQPKYDLSTTGNLLLASIITLLIGQIANVFYFRATFFDNLLAIAGAIIFAGFVVYDTQMIVNGRKKKQSFSSYFFSKNTRSKAYQGYGTRAAFGASDQEEDEEVEGALYYDSKDYILASMNLYVDFVGLVIKLMQVLSHLQDTDRSKRKDD